MASLNVWLLIGTLISTAESSMNAERFVRTEINGYCMIFRHGENTGAANARTCYLRCGPGCVGYRYSSQKKSCVLLYCQWQGGFSTTLSDDYSCYLLDGIKEKIDMGQQAATGTTTFSFSSIGFVRESCTTTNAEAKPFVTMSLVQQTYIYEVDIFLGSYTDFIPQLQIEVGTYVPEPGYPVTTYKVECSSAFNITANSSVMKFVCESCPVFGQYITVAVINPPGKKSKLEMCQFLVGNFNFKPKQ